MYPVAVSSILLLASLPALFLLCLHFSVAPDGEEEEEARHTRNKSSYTYLHTTVYSGCNSEIGGRGNGGGGREDEIFLFGAAHSSHGGVRKTPYTPVYTLSFSISGLFHLSSSRVIWTSQPVAEEKPKPSYNLSARSCHLTTAVFSLYTTDKHFLSFLFFSRPSFHPSASRNFHYWFHFVWFSPPFVQCFLPTC